MRSNSLKQILETAYPVLPVVVLDDLDNAVPLAQTLVQNGIRVVEITLRTPCTLQAIKQIKRQVPELKVGAGTLTHVEQIEELLAIGVDFAVSPGTSLQLLEYAKSKGLPLLPGVMTPSDILTVMQLGLDIVKLFPAASIGGIDYLSALRGPFPEMKFCPTGGIDENSYKEYLKIDNVLCVGGSWLAPAELIRRKLWLDIGARCAAITSSS